MKTVKGQKVEIEGYLLNQFALTWVHQALKEMSKEHRLNGYQHDIKGEMERAYPYLKIDQA